MSQPITLQSALTPELLKSVLTNSLLKEIMTDSVCSRNWCEDANLIEESGVYPCAVGTLNVPMGAEGTIIHFKSPNATFGHVQMFCTPGSTREVFIRIWWSSEWRSWLKFATEIIT